MSSFEFLFLGWLFASQKSGFSGLRYRFIPSLRFGTDFASPYNPCHCLKLKNSKLNLILYFQRKSNVKYLFFLVVYCLLRFTWTLFCNQCSATIFFHNYVHNLHYSNSFATLQNCLRQLLQFLPLVKLENSKFNKKIINQLLDYSISLIQYRNK